MSIEDDNRCCDKFSPVLSEGEHVCSGCGVVLGKEEVKDEFGSKTFDNKKNTDLRQNAPLSTYAGELLTVIDGTGKDYAKNKLSPEVKRMMERLKLWDKRAKTYEQRRLKPVMMDLASHMFKLGYTDSHFVEASKMYVKAFNENIIRGRTVTGMEAAAAYAVSKKYGLGRTLKSVSKEFNVPPSHVSRCYMAYKKADTTNEASKPLDSEDALFNEYFSYAKRIIKNIGLENKESKILSEFSRIINIKEIAHYRQGKRPGSIVTAIVRYVVENDDPYSSIRVKDFSEASGVSGVSVNSRYKELLKIIDKLDG